MDDFKRAFVTGWPVDHSRSPLIHKHWLAIHGLQGDYVKHPCEPEGFADFIENLDQQGFVGGNVTIPHKESAFERVDLADETATRLGAINTVWRENGKTHGSNTDGYGFLANLDQQSPDWDSPERLKRPALVLGAGGASRAIIVGLLDRGFDRVVIANRTLSRAQNLQNQFGDKCLATELNADLLLKFDPSIVVNTTSLGMGGEGDLPINLSDLSDDTLVSDIVYTPLITSFLKAARDAGLQTVDGLGMLLHQAVPGFEKWFGVRPEVTEELRNIILRDLGELPTTEKTIFLGLTGSIGMGKSTTAQMFRELGVPVNDSDAVVHQLYSGKAAPLVEQAFPSTVIEGVVDRSALSKYVVGNDTNMKKLEAIVHPLVREVELSFRKRVEQEGAPLAVFDSPLLFERQMERAMDGVVVVTAPADVQKQRVMARPSMSEGKFEALLARQMSDDDKCKRADFIIDTSLGMDDARRAVRDIVDTVQSRDSADWKKS